MAQGNQYTWVEFYQEFADKLLPYRNNRIDLISKIKAVYESNGMKLPTLEKDGKVVDIDPFTVFGLFNKGITNANRISIIRGIAKEFGVAAPVPETFDGIPVLNNQKATFYWFIGGRGENDIDNLWGIYAAALDYADTRSETSKNDFIKYYDACIQQKGVKWNITMGLYWIRPYTYINLDGRNRWYITNPENMPAEYVDSIGKLNEMPNGDEYLRIIAASINALSSSTYDYKSFPELSYFAWKISEEVNEQNRISEAANQRGKTGTAIGDEDVEEVHYWIYSPGYGSSKWEEFYENGIMAIAREYIGDLSQYATKKDMQAAMQEKCPRTPDVAATTFSKAALETWQFLHGLKPGDVVFAKDGQHTIIGRGVVTSDYIYDPSRDEEYVNVRKVKWTHKGEWKHPGNAITKVLTDITSYTEYVEQLNALFEENSDAEEIETPEIVYPAYSAEDFLSEVFMSEHKYEVLVNLLKNKKNIILQGAPGVGKTFAAKRLCYSMMGVKDPNRVMMVQFHQSYSYEDFIMGFRPATTGFELKKGPFYNFCKKAELDNENDYFFIIDEINRGNLSKIFGELFMLIENDKRGVSLQLLYSDEKFSVPKNVYLVGMMNTADRSLAMLDYALRRRFAFFEFAPAFDTDGFRVYRQEKNNPKFDRLIAAVERLNIAIEDDDTLGRGFCIGHSYFCTDGDIDDAWLDAVITYEIIPLLNEYWFDEPGKVRDWERNLREAIK